MSAVDPIDDGIVDAEVQPRPCITAYEHTVETRTVVADFAEIHDAGTDILLDDLREAIHRAAHLPGIATVAFRTDGSSVRRLVIEHRTVTR